MCCKNRWFAGFAVVALVFALMIPASTAAAADKKPDILIIWCDDIGGFNRVMESVTKSAGNK